MTSKNDITTRPVSLAALLEGIAAGEVVLPDFQRDFDWNSSEVVSLLATLLRGWPAGSLLLMRGEPEFFNTREFEFAPHAVPPAEYVVLDGQQRLTACFLALRGHGPRVFALEYGDSMLHEPRPSAEELEERIKVIPRDIWERDWGYLEQARRRVVPLFNLNSAADFFEWRDRVAASVGEGVGDGVATSLSRLYRQLLGTVNHYDFPAVILENDFPSEAVARIFERINRSGRRLNTFDLLVARSYSKDWNLRDKWAEAVRDSAAIEEFQKDDGLPALQLISLHDREDVRQPALLKIPPARVQDGWQDAVDALEAALHQVRELGVVDPEYLPYRAQLLTIGGLKWGAGSSDMRQVIEPWFWRSSFGSTYDVGSSTQVVADLRELRRRRDQDFEGEAIALAEDHLLGATRQRTPALWRAFHALLGRLKACDPVTGMTLDRERADSVVVSVLPRAQGQSFHLRVFGQVRVSRETARKAKSQSVLQQILDGDAASEVLESQLLPSREMLGALVRDPSEFLRWRINATELRLAQLANAPVITVVRDSPEAENPAAD